MEDRGAIELKLPIPTYGCHKDWESALTEDRGLMLIILRQGLLFDSVHYPGGNS